MEPKPSQPAAQSHFLIIGVGRSGTTLLANCLDSHPDVCCLNEAADDALRGKDRPEYTALRLLAHGRLTSRLAAAMERDVDSFYDPNQPAPGGQVPLGLLRVEAFHAETSQLLAARPEHTAGNKVTTESVAMIYRPPFAPDAAPAADLYETQRAERLRYFCELFAAYRLLFMVRDGRRVVASKTRRAGMSASGAAVRWLEGARIHRALAAWAADRMLTLRFEDLLRAPEDTLRSACSFLEVEFVEEMLAGSQRPYANEPHTGFDRQNLSAPANTENDEWLREGLAYFDYC